MPLFGICTSVENGQVVKAAGWDFVEENVQGLLQGEKSDAEWGGMERMGKAELPRGGVPAANCLVPGSLKIVGPTARLEALRPYMQNVVRRAKRVGMKHLVFGSGGARNVPEGFDWNLARQQILAFAKMSADLAAAEGVTIVVEHLNKKECNIINSVAEAMEYVKAVGHPNFQCLVDVWHVWQENEPLSHVAEAMVHVKHVHLADKEGRVAPGQGGSDYREFFGILKRAKYEGGISVEAKFVPDLGATAKDVLAFVKRQWAEA